jgi:hypothetical protein
MSLFCDIVAVGECSGDPGDHRKKALRPGLTRRLRSTARRGGARGQPPNLKQRCDASRVIRCYNAVMKREEEKDEARARKAQNKGTSAVAELGACLPGERCSLHSAEIEQKSLAGRFMLPHSYKLSLRPCYIQRTFQNHSNRQLPVLMSL